MIRNEKIAPATSSGVARVLSLIATGAAKTRLEVGEVAGLARSTVTDRLNTLFQAGLVEEGDALLPSGGGRPTKVLKVNTNFGVVLAADIGESVVHVAVTDLEPNILAEKVAAIDIQSGPEIVLAQICEEFEELLEEIGRPKQDVMGVGLGLPAPVDHFAGCVVGPSVLTGWDDYDIQARMRLSFDTPIYVENDVNLMTLCEVRQHWADCDQLVFIKAGTGIGSGIITDGHLHRGAHGAAGDIGHIQLHGDSAPLCRCGKLGCVEAHAGGWAIARDLKAKGFDAANARDVIELVKKNQPEAVHLVRTAGRVLGEVTASVVSIINPSVIVIGGTLSAASEHLFAGIRELVYQRSLPLATRTLRIEVAKSDARTGLLFGAARMVIEAQMQPAELDRTIRRLQLKPLADAA